MRRVVVVGASGSGKTTLARAIAQRLSVPHVELDFLSGGSYGVGHGSARHPDVGCVRRDSPIPTQFDGHVPAVGADAPSGATRLEPVPGERGVAYPDVTGRSQKDCRASGAKSCRKTRIVQRDEGVLHR